MGALVIIVVSYVVRCVLVWRLANEEKWGRGGWKGGGGVMAKCWGVAFELFEVAVVGIGILFASKRHERDKGALESFRQHTRGR